jgi:hypothetical protein
LLEVPRKKTRTPFACAYPVRHRPWPEPRDRSPDIIEYRPPRQETKAKYGYLPKSAYGGRVVIDRADWFGLENICRGKESHIDRSGWFETDCICPRPRLDGLSTFKPREEMRHQTDETLLTHWQDDRSAPRVAYEARRRLVEKYQNIVYQPNRDYMQAAQFALLRCIDTCEPGRSLKVFANRAIYNAISDYKQKQQWIGGGAVYRPEDSDDSFKYRWARDGQKEMLLASEATDDKRGSDLSFDYRYFGDEDDEEGYEMVEDFEYESDTFDRQRNAERIELDRWLNVLDPRERHIIEERS